MTTAETSSTSPVKVLVVGSIKGNVKPLIEKITTVNSKNGPFNLLLCVGDFFGKDEQGEWTESTVKDLKMPIPTYIISGSSVPPQAVLDLGNKSNGDLAENLTHLGGFGTFTTTEGLKIAYLSGVYNKEAYYSKEELPEASNPEAPTHIPTTPFYQIQDIKSLASSIAPAATADPSETPYGVDILITHEWAENITKSSSLAQNLSLAADTGAENGFSRELIQVVNRLQPRYHFAASLGKFLEREPYRNEEIDFGQDVKVKADHVTRFIALGDFMNDTKQRWLYAMNLVPIATIDRAQLQATPANTTSNPFTFIESFSGKRQRNNREEDQSRKRTKRTTPPEGYVCRKCNVVGHWIEDCTVSPPPRENGPRGLPDGYVCKICNVPGHHIRDCTQKPEAKEEMQCWFCLSAPTLAKHLLVGLGTEVYLSVAKGPLVENHLLIVPVTHFPSSMYLDNPEKMTTLMEEGSATKVSQELDTVKEKIINLFREAKSQDVVFFEVFGGGNASRYTHMCVQAIPIPNTIENALETLTNELDYFGWVPATEESMDVSAPFMKLELNGTKVLLQAKPHNQRPPSIQGARFVLSRMLGVGERGDWKKCVLSMEEETKDAQTVREFVKEVIN